MWASGVVSTSSIRRREPWSISFGLKRPHVVWKIRGCLRSVVWIVGFFIWLDDRFCARICPIIYLMKTIGILGVQGKYGQWLRRFFERWGHEVIGADLGTEMSNKEVVEKADVVVFSVPIAVTIDVIEEMVSHSREGQLWMDITSVKRRPVESMLKSKAEVVGLHPMCAPTVETLHGQVMMYCPARLDEWKGFVDEFLKETEATVKEITPEAHDRRMAMIQCLPHASILMMAALNRHMGVDARELFSSTSAFYRIVLSLMGRISAQKPELYADIQFHNPDAVDVLDGLEKEIRSFKEMIASGDREKFLAEFAKSGEHFGDDVLKEGYDLFDDIIKFVAEG